MGWVALARRDLRELASLPPLELLASLWRLLRPAFWIVTIFPVYLGYVYASGQLFPAQDLWVAFLRDGLADGFTVGRLVNTLGAWLVADGTDDFVAALLVLGPFIWGGTLLYNDAMDLEADRAKELRAESPLVKGYLSASTAKGIVYVLSFVGMVLSWTIHPTFFALMAVCLFLSWAYSAPPLRLKGRPGFDVAVNVVGVGVLCFVGGWSIARPVGAFPPSLLVLMGLYLTAGYVPTTLADYHVDRRAGDVTTAVALGPKRAFHLGLSALLLGDVAFAVFVLGSEVVPPSFLVLTSPLFVAKDAVYAVMIGKVDRLERIWAGLVVFSALVAVLIGAFLGVYTGLWVL